MSLYAEPFGIHSLTRPPRKWIVRPEGQIGTVGYHPYPWTAIVVSGMNAEEAIRKAAPRFAKQRMRLKP